MLFAERLERVVKWACQVRIKGCHVTHAVAPEMTDGACPGIFTRSEYKRVLKYDDILFVHFDFAWC